MSTPASVLISGAGVAGPAPADRLNAHGWSTTPVRELGHHVAYLTLIRADQVRILRETFAGIGWETPRVRDALDDAPLYFEGIGQTAPPARSNGRVALLGDAAYCASPISGMGTDAGVAVMRTVLRVAAGPAGKPAGLVGRMTTPPAEGLELPHCPAPTPSPRRGR